MIRRVVLTLLALVALAAAASAQTSTPAPRDSAASDSAAAARAVAARRARANWLSDRRTFTVGDLVTVVVDEQTASTERVSRVSTGQRSQRADLNLGLTDTDVRLGPSKSIATAIGGNSRDVGQADRTNDLTSVLTVRVVGLEPNGDLRIHGSRKVNVDGRPQDLTLDGVVRPNDVSSHNTVLSSRVAEATILLKGKKIGPRTGIIGSVLEMLWP
jgi:flagellar L-ring protein precursor FlgH